MRLLVDVCFVGCPQGFKTLRVWLKNIPYNTTLVDPCHLYSLMGFGVSIRKGQGLGRDFWSLP